MILLQAAMGAGLFIIVLLGLMLLVGVPLLSYSFIRFFKKNISAEHLVENNWLKKALIFTTAVVLSLLVMLLLFYIVLIILSQLFPSLE